MADQWTELRQVNDRLERELEAAVARANQLEKALERIALGSYGRMKSGLREGEGGGYGLPNTPLTDWELAEAVLAGLPTEPATEEPDVDANNDAATEISFEGERVVIPNGERLVVEPAASSVSTICPTCGSPVRVHTGGEGTSSYGPQAPADTTEQARRSIEQFVLCSDGRLRNGMSVDQYRAYQGLLAALRAIREPELT